MTDPKDLNGKTLIMISPAFPGDESEEQSPWLPATQSLIRTMNRKFPGLEIIVMVSQFPVSKVEYSWYGNKIIPFGGANIRRGHNVLLWWRMFRAMVRLRKEKEIMGIMSYWCGECCLIGSYFSRAYGVSHICWISGQDAKKGNKFVWLTRPRAGELAAMSDFLQDEFYKNYKIHPRYVVPDAIDTTRFELTPSERTIDILGAGNLVPLKRYHIFVDVVTAVAAKMQNMNVMLCGSGAEEQNIKDQVAKSGMEDVITLTGLIPQKELLKHMQQAKIFLHTSEYEGFGNVCIEALYAGAHVISFTRPMKASIAHWHIVTTSEEMIAKALELLRDEKRDNTPSLPFDMNDIAQQFIDILAAN